MEFWCLHLHQCQFVLSEMTIIKGLALYTQWYTQYIIVPIFICIFCLPAFNYAVVRLCNLNEIEDIWSLGYVSNQSFPLYYTDNAHFNGAFFYGIVSKTLAVNSYAIPSEASLSTLVTVTQQTCVPVNEVKYGIVNKGNISY